LFTPVSPNNRPRVENQETKPAPAVGPLLHLRTLIRRRLKRLPSTLLNLGGYLTMMGQMLQVAVDHNEVLQRTQRRMYAEDLLKGRDDARARTIAAEELMRYRAEFQDDVMKFEVSPFETFDPWRNFGEPT
jgi:hypothetical protein